MTRLSHLAGPNCVVGTLLMAGLILAEVGPLPAAQDAQPLAANGLRILQAFQILGQPLDQQWERAIRSACLKEDAAAIEELLDPLALVKVTINPESRVKATIGQASPTLLQAGHSAFLVKVENQGAVKSSLQVRSPQAGASYAGVAALSMERQQQPTLRANPPSPDGPRRFLHLDWVTQPPMMESLGGALREYAILLIYSSDSGKREATLEFSVGQGTQDLGFRAEVPILFECRPAVEVRLAIRDQDGSTPFARMIIRDAAGRIYPAQPRRLAPDLFFQEQIYRRDGEVVLLPPGEYEIESSRGPEYQVQFQRVQVAQEPNQRIEINLQRWIDPARFGYYSGDHHIHGAGCAHYTSPTEGITPADMFRQVSGEGLHVGCVLTWGPCFEFQRQFFKPTQDELSTATTLMKYDIEVSGFGSQALGHVCLLNLRDQTYPGSEGTKEKGWPTWATPALRWAKAQGAVTGFAHSASGLQIVAKNAAERLKTQYDSDQSGMLSRQEAQAALLPAAFEQIDRNQDQLLDVGELTLSLDAAADQLPNLCIPEMNSVGAMELPVAVAEGVCDFISAMDTARIAEWNMWYHVLNCGFPLKSSGETDFPCMSGMAVGQGRSYVQLGVGAPLNYTDWCNRLAEGRSYVSDGYAHALDFKVIHADAAASSGDSLSLPRPAKVTVQTRVAFAPKITESIAYGTRTHEGGKRWIGDTVQLHGGRGRKWIDNPDREVELVVNGRVLQRATIPADGQIHDVKWDAQVEESSWIAIRSFPQLHTNPVEVLVDQRPIRASKASARWCAETIRQLWDVRKNQIHPSERAAAQEAFEHAIQEYTQRGESATNDSPGAKSAM
jgi:hypothetical protein